MLTEKLYETNSYLRDFTARVLRCEPLKLGSKLPESAAFGVVLDRTAFFPEGGGQTADTGNLGSATVLDVQETGGEIVHITYRSDVIHECVLREGIVVNGDHISE